MSIKVLSEKGVPHREVARTLGVDESTVRYHRQRQIEGAVDGRQGHVNKAAAVRPAIDAWLGARGLETPDNSAAL